MNCDHNLLKKDNFKNHFEAYPSKAKSKWKVSLSEVFRITELLRHGEKTYAGGDCTPNLHACWQVESHLNAIASRNACVSMSTCSVWRCNPKKQTGLNIESNVMFTYTEYSHKSSFLMLKSSSFLSTRLNSWNCMQSDPVCSGEHRTDFDICAFTHSCMNNHNDSLRLIAT